MSASGKAARLERAFLSELEWARGLDEARRERLVELMTIQASAYLEAACREIVIAYAARRADPEVANYVERQMDRFGAPRMDRIVALVRAFEERKARELSAFAQESGAFTRRSLAASINTLVTRRNEVAHGRAGRKLEVAEIDRHFRDARTVAKQLEELLA